MSVQYEIGDLTIHRVIEAETGGTPALEFMPNLTPERLAENRGWLAEAGGLTPDDKIVLCFQSHVVRTPHHTILIDTCNGNDKQRPANLRWNMRTDDTYTRNLAAAGVAVEEVDFVLCTHLHVDHVGWNTRLENGRWVPTFPNARYLFSARELAFFTERAAMEPRPYMADSVLPIVEAGRADLVTSTHALGDHVRLMPTPGHTPDHFAVALGRGRDAAVVTGDLIHSPLQARYPELTMRRDFDPAQAVTTRKSFLEQYCDTDTLCCTAHFPSPSTGRIKRWGEGFRCEAVASRAAQRE